MNSTIGHRGPVRLVREPTILMAAFVIIASMWTFAELTDEVFDAESMPFDTWMLQVLRQHDDPGRPIGPAWVGNVARDVTALGSVAVLGLVTVLSAMFLWLCHARRTALFLLSATIAGTMVCQGAKYLLERPRPDVVPHLDIVHTGSYPSGHSMMSAVVYLTLAVIGAAVVDSRRLKSFLLASAFGLTALVGISRVYLGVHYPTDVLAGWMLGLGWALVCWIVARVLQERGTVVESLDTPAAHGDEPAGSND